MVGQPGSPSLSPGKAPVSHGDQSALSSSDNKPDAPMEGVLSPKPGDSSPSSDGGSSDGSSSGASPPSNQTPDGFEEASRFQGHSEVTAVVLSKREPCRFRRQNALFKMPTVGMPHHRNSILRNGFIRMTAVREVMETTCISSSV